MHWDNLHEEAFDHVKATIALEVVLAYPDFSKPFEIYTDASATQLGVMVHAWVDHFVMLLTLD